MALSQQTATKIPDSAIGFTAILRGSPTQTKNSQAALARALSHFGDEINHTVLEIGNTQLILWGRGQLDNCTYTLSDGNVLALIGSPVGDFYWGDIAERLLRASAQHPFVLPWDGRVILLKIDPTGDVWTLWNDWIGSIPVFYAQTPSGQIASTLEPAVVDALDFAKDDIFLPALLALLIWGHYFDDWTLFKDLKVIPPDSQVTWENGKFHFTQDMTVTPSDDRMEAGWDDLIDEMYALSKQAIAQVLSTQSQWILPLSSGLDSRLIAGVAADQGVNVYTYTWGPAKTSDVIHAKSIARALDLPWKNIDPGNSYLTTYHQLWANLFGDAMHFHGMYQMPFLDALKNEPSGPIISGFIGECLTGYDMKILIKAYSGKYPFQISPDDYLHWCVKDLYQLMKVPIDTALDELASKVITQIDSFPGPLYHRLRLNVLWGRQRSFTYFQSMLSSYWRGVATPYLNRDYARFSYSLPRVVFDERVLQQAMLRRYYTKLATIPGTYAPEPALLTGSYLLKKRIAKHLPEKITDTVFPGLKKTRSNSDIECVRNSQKASFFPLFENLDKLEMWMNTDLIEENFEKIVPENNIKAIRKLQSIQTLAYHLTS
jgi:hypothetical protein